MAVLSCGMSSELIGYWLKSQLTALHVMLKGLDAFSGVTKDLCGASNQGCLMSF